MTSLSQTPAPGTPAVADQPAILVDAWLTACYVFMSLLLLWVLLAACPWLLFGRARIDRGYSIYSDGPLPPGLSLAITKANRRLVSQGLTPPHGQKIYFFASRWRFVLLNGAMPDSLFGAFRKLSWGISLVTPNLVNPPASEGPAILERTLAHELAHAAIFRSLGRHYGELARWKDEGVASRVEFATDARIHPAAGRYSRIESEYPQYFAARTYVTAISGTGPLTDTTLLRVARDTQKTSTLQAAAHLSAPPPRDDPSVETWGNTIFSPPVWFFHSLFGSAEALWT
jgi:hypothetical protein